MRNLSFPRMGDPSHPTPNKSKNRVPLRALARIASVAAGVQFGWALQLSLLTPYIEQLGIPHAWASYIWLCGPISGMFVQPLVGHLSDQCESGWGRRRPFIMVGAFLVVVAVLIICFSADLGHLLGDSLLSRPRAITIFVLGFWILDLANNTLQGPCRALLADLTGKDHRRTRRANAFFSLFMAVGNVLGFATGSFNGWYKVLPFTKTVACNTSCANLKSAFLLGVIVLVITTILSVTAAQEIPRSHESRRSKQFSTSTTSLLSEKRTLTHFNEVASDGRIDHRSMGFVDEEEDETVEEAFFCEILSTLRDLPKPMWYILFVTALTWFAWFPFLLFDTDWMGREVFLGEPSVVEVGSAHLYDMGIRSGSFGLMLNSVVLGLTSLLIESICRRMEPRKVWALANVIMSACFVGTVIITAASKHALREESGLPSTDILVWAYVVFAVLGAPLAVTYSVPYALAATVTNISGRGQGLSMGVLNLAIVVPQVLVSVGSGSWDELFGGGNVPAFFLAAVAALVGGLLAAVLLPNPTSEYHDGGIRRTRSSPIP